MKTLSPHAGLLCIVALFGCASGKPSAQRDASVDPTEDGGVPEIDAPTTGQFGDPCEDHLDCAEFCYRPDPEEPGFCTEECDGVCPDGYACRVVMIGDLNDARVCVPAEDTLCTVCSTNQECGDSGDFCVSLTAGQFCTIDCAGNPSVCPAGFTCQQVGGDGDTVIGMQCMPLNGVCCVDGDGDVHGEGDGCIGPDCDDSNPAVHEDHPEICDGYDNDCEGTVDVDVTDCQPAACLLGMLGYYERPGEPCTEAVCVAQSAQLCGLYTCDEGGEQGDACATSCDVEDDGKCIPTAHCDASSCYSDLADGLACDETSDCQSDHCGNGFCCAFGDCCQTAMDCPSYGTFDPVCDNPITCQGSRGEAVCGPTFICSTSGVVQDDSACDSTVRASDCGWYLDLYCTGALDQSAPACPTSCSSHADCDPGGFSDPATSTCIEDLDNGGACDADDARCKSGHCGNGFCCAFGDCCQVEDDCPAAYSTDPTCDVPSACQGTRDVAQCVSNVCGTATNVGDDSACDDSVLASNCGPYDAVYCDGNSVQNPPVCPDSCTSDLECDGGAYCDTTGACVLDEPDGGSCDDDDECQSGHCGNGFCCASGDCCADSNDCGAYDEPSVCDDSTTCQGTRVDGVCTGSFQCAQAVVADDSGCATLEADDCGPYPPVYCTAGQNQPPPVCPSSCASDGDCDVSAHCDSDACVPDAGQGGFCDEASDCDSGLFCVDNVCCNTACNGTCAACDLPGSEGVCTLVGDGQDPDNECGAVSCGGYYWGYDGDTCHRRADVSAAQASCDGAGACRSAAVECPASGQGPADSTCDDLCQDPRPGTCAGTTAGACDNVDAGTDTCGQGVCQVTEPRCISGVPNTCTPNDSASSPEACNNVDDNCDGTVDNGNFSDPAEPNGSCASYRTLTTVTSNQYIDYTNLTLYGAGDHDYYRIVATESDSSCSCCDFFCTDEDYKLFLYLSVPAGAGSYMFCTGQPVCGDVNDNCQEVLAGQNATWEWTMDGGCFSNDSYSVYVHIYGDNPPGYECTPYLFSYEFQTGCFGAFAPENPSPGVPAGSSLALE